MKGRHISKRSSRKLSLHYVRFANRYLATHHGYRLASFETMMERYGLFYMVKR